MSYITKYVKNNNFSTVLINFIFQFECRKEEIISNTILSKILSVSNNYFIKEKDFAIEKLKRYIINYSCSGQSINNVYFIDFNLMIPNPTLIKEDILESAIYFVLDCIYKPNIENNCFNEHLFEREKRLYIEHLLNGYNNIEFIAEKNLLDILDQDGIFNKIKYKDLENIKYLTNEEVMTFYTKYIKNTKPKIFVNGNIDIKNTEKILSTYMSKLDLKENRVIKKYNWFYNDFSLVEKEEKANYFQSIVYMIYAVKDYNEEDFYKLLMINLLLSSSSSDLLLCKLRKQNNLVYTCGSSVLLRNGLLLIKAVTSKKNINLSKLVIQDLVLSFKDMEQYKENVTNIMYRLSLNLERKKDEFVTYSNNIINKYFNTNKTDEEEYNILYTIEKKELENIAERLSLKCIYTMEGNRE